MRQTNGIRPTFSSISRNVAFVLSSLLAFTVPFGAARNIDMQGLLLLVAGSFAWLTIGLNWRPTFAAYDRLALSLLAILVVAYLLSTVLNSHLSDGLLGAPYLRLGALGMVACIGIGFVVAQMKAKALLQYLYLFVLTAALVSVPYSWLKFESLWRLPGLFAQADIMAVCLGCGLLLGLYLWQAQIVWRKYLFVSQVFLLALLLLTGTRVVLALTLLLCFLWLLQQRPKTVQALIYLTCLVLITVVAANLSPGRYSSVEIGVSTTYRLSLEQAAWQAIDNKPLLGYGPGNVADALVCHRFNVKVLQRTCQDGYYFNSSHNIFLDRVLAIGWLGGLAYASLFIIAVYRGLKGNAQLRVMAYCLLLIGLYYLTNVTSIVLEMLVWVLLLRCLSRASA